MIDLPRALYRGYYGRYLGQMQHRGISIDTLALDAIRKHEARIVRELLWRGDQKLGLFDIRRRKFRKDRFELWLDRQGIIWPRTKPAKGEGQLATSKRVMRSMQHISQEIRQIGYLKSILSGLDCAKLAVGQDGRNRAYLGPAGTLTGRNQPSPTEFIYGISKTFRHLIKPRPGYAYAQCDYEQQEVGIAACLSGDASLLHDYLHEIYMAFAVRAGLAPAGATKKTHPIERQRCKGCVLGMQYGMGAESLSLRIQQSAAHAERLIDLYWRSYPKLREWIDGTLNYALLHGSLETQFGWKFNITEDTKPSTLKNFMVQATGGEILRVAVIRAAEAGVAISAPVHDCLLIEAPAEEIEYAIEKTHAAMREASRRLLNGFELMIDTKRIYAPDRYRFKPEDPETQNWNTLWDTAVEIEPSLRSVAERCR